MYAYDEKTVWVNVVWHIVSAWSVLIVLDTVLVDAKNDGAH